jgi:HTH-type transcriptional regulator, competence development regulator
MTTTIRTTAWDLSTPPRRNHKTASPVTVADVSRRPSANGGGPPPPAEAAAPAIPEIGEVLRRARLHRGLSLRDVERRTDISNAHISQIERGRIRRPEPAILFELAQTYDLNYGLLAEWAGYIDSELPIDADLLDSVVRLFVGLDASGQENALQYLEQLRGVRTRDDAQ